MSPFRLKATDSKSTRQQIHVKNQCLLLNSQPIFSSSPKPVSTFTFTAQFRSLWQQIHAKNQCLFSHSQPNFSKTNVYFHIHDPVFPKPVSAFTFTTQFVKNQCLLSHSRPNFSKTNVYFHIHDPVFPNPVSTFTFTTQFFQNQCLLSHSRPSLSKTSVYFHIHCLVLSPHGSRYKTYLRQPVLMSTKWIHDQKNECVLSDSRWRTSSLHDSGYKRWS